MKLSATELKTLVSTVYLGGLINELVIQADGTFAVADDSKSVVVTSNEPLKCDASLGQVGFFGLDLLINAIDYASTSIFSSDILDVVVENNRLIFKKGKNEFKFLLCNPTVVASTLANPAETLKKIRAKEGSTVKLAPTDIEKCLKSIQIISPETVAIVASGGQLYLTVGKELEHNSTICLGVSDKDFSLRFKPDLLVKILSEIHEDVTLEVRPTYPALLVTKKFTFIVAPIKDAAK